MDKILFHITEKENVESIKKTGLKVNEDGLLFLFEGCDVKASRMVNGEVKWFFEPLDSVIARNEVFLKDYAMVVCKAYPKGLEVDERDGIMSAGYGHKFSYCYNIPAKNILNVIDRSVVVDETTLEPCDNPYSQFME